MNNKNSLSKAVIDVLNEREGLIASLRDELEAVRNERDKLKTAFESLQEVLDTTLKERNEFLKLLNGLHSHIGTFGFVSRKVWLDDYRDRISRFI